MRKLSINLPVYRLHLQLVKRQGASFGESLLPKLNEIKNVKSGTKFSRFFRHVFEHKSIKKIFGTNLALMLVLGTFIPVQENQIQAEETIIHEADVTLTTVTERVVQYPLNGGYISQGYSIFHPALDFAVPRGTEIKPVKDGVIEDISRSNVGYGNAIIVNHGNDITSLYAHLSKIEVSKGDKVTVFDTIGKVGTTGRATGPHLHLEIRRRGIPINPFAVLPSLASSKL